MPQWGRNHFEVEVEFHKLFEVEFDFVSLFLFLFISIRSTKYLKLDLIKCHVVFIRFLQKIAR